MQADYPKIKCFKHAPLKDRALAVNNWLNALHKADLLWHMDDSALDIPNFTAKGIAEGLEAERQKALKLCKGLSEGIWGLKIWKEIL